MADGSLSARGGVRGRGGRLPLRRGRLGGFTRGQFPWGTFAINHVGCFALGVLVEVTTSRLLPHPNWRVALGIGFLAVDEAERIDAILPKLDEMVGEGLVTAERVEVVAYRSNQP
jgi:hypothetical protein